MRRFVSDARIEVTPIIVHNRRNRLIVMSVLNQQCTLARSHAKFSPQHQVPRKSLSLSLSSTTRDQLLASMRDRERKTFFNSRFWECRRDDATFFSSFPRNTTRFHERSRARERENLANDRIFHSQLHNPLATTSRDALTNKRSRGPRSE